MCVSHSLLPANSRVSNCQEEGFWKWEDVRLGFNILASFVSGKATWRTGHTDTNTRVPAAFSAPGGVFPIWESFTFELLQDSGPALEG